MANDPMRFAGTSMLQVLPKSLVIAANALVREAKTLNSATDTARGSTRDELADLMLTHARTLGLHAESREASASDRAQADALRDALMHEHARIVALPGPKPLRTTYYTDPSIDPRTQAAYTNRAPRRKELDMSEKAGPGDKAAEAFRLIAAEARHQAGRIDSGETDISIRKGPIERAIDAIGSGRGEDHARVLLASMLGMVYDVTDKRGWKLAAASLRTVADQAKRQAGMWAQMTVPGSKETEMDDERGTLWDALKRALKSNPKREKAYNYAPGQIANRTVSQAESDVAHAIDACYNAGKNLKRLEEAISRLEDVLQNIDEASSLARRKSDVPTLRALEAIYNKGELEMNRYEEKLSRIEMNRGSKWSSLHAKEASEKAGGPGAKAADAFALMATEAAAQAGFIDRGETEIFIRKGPIERAINAIGTGKAQDDARALLRNMVGMAQGPINPTEGKRGISMKLVAASLRTIAEHANEQARMYASMTVPGSKEESMSEKETPDQIRALEGRLGRALNSLAMKVQTGQKVTEADNADTEMADASAILDEYQGMADALRRLQSVRAAFEQTWSTAKRKGLVKEVAEKGTDNDGEQWDEQGWGNPVEFDEDGNPKPAARAEADEDGDTLEGIMKAARSEKANLTLSSSAQGQLYLVRDLIKDVENSAEDSTIENECQRATAIAINEAPGRELRQAVSNIQNAFIRRQDAGLNSAKVRRLDDTIGRLSDAVDRYLAARGIRKEAGDMTEKAGFPFQKKKKPAADPNAEADPNAQQAQPQQGQQPAQQQAPAKAQPFQKKKVPTPGQQPGMPMAEQNPQDGDAQDAEDPADIQTDAQGNQLGTNGEFAGQTVGSMTADQFGTALAAAMQPVIQAIAALNAATVQRTKEETDVVKNRLADLEGEQPVLTRLERGYRASQKGPAPDKDAAAYPMPNSAPSTEETFLDWALNGSNGKRP